MASTCGSTLALLDAGVPLSASVGGVAMGLVTENGTAQGKYAILSDIQGIEDALGDMDFKVTGTREGVTAIQMDIKVAGLTEEILRKALEQAREGRMYILDKMDAVNAENTQKAIDWIRSLTREVEAGEVYTGKVTRILPFGAFVEILPGKEGLVHISELANYRVPTVEDVVNIGDEIQVLVTEIDRQGRVNLSRRALLEPAEDGQEGGEEGAERAKAPAPAAEAASGTASAAAVALPVVVASARLDHGGSRRATARAARQP